MVTLTPIQFDDGTNSLTRFLSELSKKHHGQEEQYIAQLIRVVKEFEEYGPSINMYRSKKFPPYKELNSIIKGLSELRTYKCRYFIYKIDKYKWIGLHGYEKHGDDMPKNQITKVKGEIKRWEEQKGNK